MRKLLFLLVTILFNASNFCSAQVTFQKAIGGALTDLGKAILQTTDGGYIIAGKIYYSSIYLFDDKAYLIKTNSNGDLLWAKTFFSPLDFCGENVMVFSSLFLGLKYLDYFKNVNNSKKNAH